MAEYAVVLGVISAATVGIFAALAGATHGLIDAVLSAVSAIP
jgi:Flp pilus assembly pilin Flp